MKLLKKRSKSHPGTCVPLKPKDTPSESQDSTRAKRTKLGAKIRRSFVPSGRDQSKPILSEQVPKGSCDPSSVDHERKSSLDSPRVERSPSEQVPKEQHIDTLSYTSGELLFLRQDISEESRRVLKMLNNSYEQALDPKIKYALHSKLEWYSLLPFESSASFETDDPKKYLGLLREELDKKLYGLEQVKEQIIMVINDRLRNPNCKRNIIVLKGQKASGKTKIAQIVANTIGLPFYKIALGGLIDATVFKGSDQVWSGSSPSMILQILARSRCSNPVILLDEIDKLSHSEKGIEVANSMLHLLDPTQNTQFHDLFLSEIPHDISGILFFVTMNESSPLADALKDRLEIIEIPPYTTKDMVQIAKKHIFPELMVEKNVESELITLSDEAVELLCATKGKESLRTVEHDLARLISKLSLLNTMGETHPEAGFVTFPCEVTVEYIKALCSPLISDAFYGDMYT